jgi:tRNA-Thr(GGU) m(6)t(6)A37 methyltransferase TsaA
VDVIIAVDDPRTADVKALLEQHLAFAHEVTPAGHVHALDAGGLLDPAVTFFSARVDGVLAGVGALKHLGETHAELKSMHTSADFRRHGVGQAMVDRLLTEADQRGYTRVSLETGTMEAFGPARRLYQRAGFRPCDPFGQYTSNPYSICMTITLGPPYDWRPVEATEPNTVIGIVRTGRATPENTPIQAALNRAERGTIEIDPRYQDGLEGLDGFSHAWLLSWLHRPHDTTAGPVPLRQVPFLLRPQQRKIGVFATRGPRRVNPLGLSLIELIEVAGTIVHFAGVDLIDGTPVIDLKPYVGRFDRPAGEPRNGWFDQVTIEEEITPADLGRSPGPG